MKFEIKDKSYYLKIIVSFILFCMTVVFTMSAVFSKIYSTSLVESIAREYLDSLSRVNVSISNVFEQADNLYTYMQLNKNIYEYLYTFEDDMILAMKAQNAADQIKNIDSNIDSIWLYNNNLNYYISTGSSLPLQKESNDLLIKNIVDSNFPTMRIIKRISLNEILDAQGATVSEIAELNRHDNIYILSIIYKNFSINKELTNVTTLNINETYIQRDIFNNLEGHTIVIDINGEMLIPDKSSTSRDTMLIDYVYKNAIVKGIEKGSLQYRDDTTATIVTYVRNNDFDCYIINERPISNITRSVKDSREILYVLCTIILLIFIIVGFFVASRLYSPIRTVIKLCKSKISVGNNNVGEFSLITNIIEDTSKRMGELMQNKEKNMVTLKDTLLRILVINGLSEEDEKKLTHECALKICFKNLILVSIKVDIARSIEDENITITDTMIKSTISNVLDNNFIYEMTEISRGEICILINYENNAENSFEALITALIKVKAIVYQIIDKSITIGIGGAANCSSECMESYRKAIFVVKHRFIFGLNKIIFERDITEKLSSGLIYPVELRDQLLIAIRNNDKNKFEKILAQTIDLFKNYIYSDVIIAFLKLTMDCLETMNEIVGRVRRIDFDFVEFNSNFMEMLTLEDTKNWFQDIFSEYQNTLDEMNSSKVSKFICLVEDAKTYIHENFSDGNLNVEMLAEKMGYSPKYFSKVFKDITGRLLSDYIRQVRISKAKELLYADEYRINDIANMTGFVNLSYFYSTFKNDVGMTPSEYKKFYQKN